jgi:2'-5' RNA ligase
MPDINNGTYVCLSLTTRSAERLHSWAANQGLNNIEDPTEFHITVCYSKRPLFYVPLGYIPPLPVKPAGFDLFGKEKEYLVLKVTSWLANNRHEYAIMNAAQHDFPDYKPHITLAKNSGITNLRDIEPFTDILYVNKETVSVLRD